MVCARLLEFTVRGGGGRFSLKLGYLKGSRIFNWLSF